MNRHEEYRSYINHAREYDRERRTRRMCTERALDARRSPGKDAAHAVHEPIRRSGDYITVYVGGLIRLMFKNNRANATHCVYNISHV